MTIVCGTDFSQNADGAARAAAAIAGRLKLPLELVHVTASAEAEPALKSQLTARARELARQFGIDVEPVLEAGIADERLVALAGSGGARLLVVGSLGAHKQHRWLIGSVAERAAQSSSVPVLVVRDGASLEAWARGGRVLRVMVGVELTASSKVALSWARALQAVSPCEVRVVQVVWPPEAHQRTGLAGPMPLDQLRPELEERMLGELKQWVADPAGQGEVTLLVKAGWGRVDHHLTTLAAESNVDLLVVGAHKRAGVARFWQGSVSRGVLHGAQMNVACIPSPQGDPAR